MAVVSMSYLLEAGVHFGHQTKRWNPKMKEYIFTAREDIHIIDLQKTSAKIEEAYQEILKIAKNGGTFLFVGTKKQANECTIEEATRSKSHYVVSRWLGGTLTNFRTIRSRVKRLIEIEDMEANGTFDVLPKKEVIGIKKEYEKLLRVLVGIREMNKLPGGIIVVDPKKEINAIREARKLRIPVFGLVDTNCDPDDVDFVIPANDDAVRSVKLVLGVLANAICEATGLELVEYVTEEDKKSNQEALSMAELEQKEVQSEEPTKEPTSIEAVEEKSEIEVEDEPKNEESPENEDLSKLTLTDLKRMAKEKGIKGYSTLKKEELIESLR